MSEKDENVIVYYDPLFDKIWTGVFYTTDHMYYLIGENDSAVRLRLDQNLWIPDRFVMIGKLNA